MFLNAGFLKAFFLDKTLKKFEANVFCNVSAPVKLPQLQSITPSVPSKTSYLLTRLDDCTVIPGELSD